MAAVPCAARQAKPCRATVRSQETPRGNELLVCGPRCLPGHGGHAQLLLGRMDRQNGGQERAS